MSDLWLGDVGIRVTNLDRSIDFYTKVFDLEEIDRGGDEHSTFVLFRDRRSRQRLELNWYAEDNPFWAPYVPGEALDHFEVRVKSVPETLQRLKGLGILPATKKPWVNRRAIAKLNADPDFRKTMKEDVWTSQKGTASRTSRIPMASSSASTTTPKNPGKVPFRITIEPGGPHAEFKPEHGGST